MADADKDGHYAKSGSDGRGTARQVNGRRARIGREDLNVLPRDFIVESATKGFDRRFLRRYAPGDHVGLSRTFSKLSEFSSREPTEEKILTFREQRRDPRDADDINPVTENIHAAALP